MATIAILDDEPERINAMLPLLQRSFPHLSIAIFDNAPEMLTWLMGHLDECHLICLDHDLGANRIRGGEPFDPGTGRDVADYLAKHAPTCPVIVHTTNCFAAPGMELVLTDAGWSCKCVSPYDDLVWIGEIWIEQVNHALGFA